MIERQLYEALMQYYGIDNDGKTKYVAMSKDEVEKFAESHPEENITRVEDKFGHGYKINENYEEDLEKVKEIFYKLEDYLNKQDHNLMIDDMWYSGTDRTITCHIDWGDWKHEHGMLKYLLTRFMYENHIKGDLDQVITDEDGSDTYSADHIITLQFDSSDEDI